MNTLGTIQSLTLSSYLTDGYLLVDSDRQGYFLPKEQAPENPEVGTKLPVFTYVDANGRLMATTQKPHIKLHEYAILEIIQTSEKGAYADWGLEPPLFIPLANQHKELEVGKWYLMYLLFDDHDNTLVCTTLVNDLPQKLDVIYRINQEVDLLVYEETNLGFNVIVNHRHKGLVFHNEVFQEVSYGERLKGYIKRVREDDKLDILLQPMGFARIESSEDAILTKLRANEGFLPLHDKSDPNDIIEQLGMSKKTFKKAVGALYKQKYLVLEEGGIRLV